MGASQLALGSTTTTKCRRRSLLPSLLGTGTSTQPTTTATTEAVAIAALPASQFSKASAWRSKLLNCRDQNCTSPPRCPGVACKEQASRLVTLILSQRPSTTCCSSEWTRQIYCWCISHQRAVAAPRIVHL